MALYNFVEDAATAEICRAQLWQWLRHGAPTCDGREVTAERFDRLLTDELDRIHGEVGPARLATGVFPTAARLFEQTFVGFTSGAEFLAVAVLKDDLFQEIQQQPIEHSEPVRVVHEIPEQYVVF